MIIDPGNLYQTMPGLFAQRQRPTLAIHDDGDGAVPAELRQWLVQLRLLVGVPFAYLVADSDLLPPESIRWFYMDRQWTDALVQGALAVGTLNSDDRTELSAVYEAVRDELDAEERNQRRRPGSDRVEGQPNQISGFLLRSQAISGWPALHVRAFSAEPGGADTAPVPEGSAAEMRLLRLERLAPAVLLCLFDGVPEVVHLEEPRAGVQFGVDSVPLNDGTHGPAVWPRNATTFARIPSSNPLHVSFRSGGAKGVIDFQAMSKALRAWPGAGTGDAQGLDSAELAVQLIRFPYRQIFGGQGPEPATVIFHPVIAEAGQAHG